MWLKITLSETRTSWGIQCLLSVSRSLHCSLRVYWPTVLVQFQIKNTVDTRVMWSLPLLTGQRYEWDYLTTTEGRYETTLPKTSTCTEPSSLSRLTIVTGDTSIPGFHHNSQTVGIWETTFKSCRGKWIDDIRKSKNLEKTNYLHLTGLRTEIV